MADRPSSFFATRRSAIRATLIGLILLRAGRSLNLGGWFVSNHRRKHETRSTMTVVIRPTSTSFLLTEQLFPAVTKVKISIRNGGRELLGGARVPLQLG